LKVKNNKLLYKLKKEEIIEDKIPRPLETKELEMFLSEALQK